jgi:methionyl-tRNA formyltransferase
MRTVLLTTSAAVVQMGVPLLAERGDELVAMATSSGTPKRPSAEFLDAISMAPHGLEILVTSSATRLAAWLTQLQPELLLCCGFPWRLTPEVLSIPKLGALNGHLSLLPRHRGPISLNWALRSGDPEFGFTVHRMDAEFDTGPILAQGAIAIDDDDTIQTMLEKVPALAMSVFHQALERAARGEVGEPQPANSGSYGQLFEPEWREIDWNRTAREIHNQVRSWGGDGAFGVVEGQRLLIHGTRLAPDASLQCAAPGSVLRRDGDQLWVQCKDGLLWITGHAPGDDPRPSGLMASPRASVARTGAARK